MNEQGFWTLHRTAGILMIGAVIPLAFGVFLFLRRNGIQSNLHPGQAVFIWERGSILAAVILTALGLTLLDAAIKDTTGHVMARLGAGAFFFGATVLVVAETMRMQDGETVYPLIVVYVVLAFLGQALIGGALLQSNLVPIWSGWAVVLWNLAWLVILTITTPSDVYFPVLHHMMPFLIGVILLSKG